MDQQHICPDCGCSGDNNTGGARCRTCSKKFGVIIKNARKKTAQNATILHENVETFRVLSSYREPKCISDKILLYIRYSLSKVDEMVEGELARPGSWRIRDREYWEEHRVDSKAWMEKKAIELYEKIRGELKYTSQSPRAVAAAIIYIAAVMSGVLLNQAVIGRYLVTSTVAIKDQYQRMKREFKL